MEQRAISRPVRAVGGKTYGVIRHSSTVSRLQVGAPDAGYGQFCQRQVFAVPIDSSRSKGCHDLIKKGAKLCEGAEDILSEFEYLFPPSNRPPSPAESGVLPALELSENEQKAYDSLSQEEITVDEVIRRSGLPPSAASVALLSLEMKRMIRQQPGKLFVKNH